MLYTSSRTGVLTTYNVAMPRSHNDAADEQDLVKLIKKLTCSGGQKAFLIFVLTSAALSSMKIALFGSLLDIFSWPYIGSTAQH